MSKRESFESEDVSAVDRATKDKSNHPDQFRQAVSKPEAHTLPVDPKKAAAGASQVSRPGQPLIPDHKAPKLTSPELRRAHANHNRRENGGADPEGRCDV
jgi:hypothetical protein